MPRPTLDLALFFGDWRYAMNESLDQPQAAASWWLHTLVMSFMAAALVTAYDLGADPYVD